MKPVKSHDARNAIDALLEGRPVKVEKTRVFGCSTKWADKRADAERSLAKWDKEPVTLAKIEHRKTWLGRLIRHCLSYPGTADPKLMTFFDRDDKETLGRIVADLNPMLRGWFGYFKHARPRLFRILDGFIRRRLRAVLRKQERRPSMGRGGADHTRWTKAFFADQGLFTLFAANENARYSR